MPQSLRNSAVPRTLAEYLKRSGESQRHLAKRVGCNQSMISMMARGKRAARGKLAHDLNRATQVPIEKLVILPHPRVARKKRGPPVPTERVRSAPELMMTTTEAREDDDPDTAADDDDDAHTEPCR